MRYYGANEISWISDSKWGKNCFTNKTHTFGRAKKPRI